MPHLNPKYVSVHEVLSFNAEFIRLADFNKQMFPSSCDLQHGPWHIIGTSYTVWQIRYSSTGVRLSVIGFSK